MARPVRKAKITPLNPHFHHRPSSSPRADARERQTRIPALSNTVPTGSSDDPYQPVGMYFVYMSQVPSLSLARGGFKRTLPRKEMASMVFIVLHSPMRRRP